MSRPKLRLRLHGHACVRIDAAGSVLVIDPGEFSDLEATDGAAAVLHTHGHYDHISTERLERARARDANVELWASPAAAAASPVQGLRALVPGSRELIQGVEIDVTGGAHAEIYPGQDAGDNVGLLVAGAIYHPGDSFALPPGGVEVLLAPIQAPWSSVADVVDFIREVAPRMVVPIHDGLLGSIGIAAFDRNIVTRIGAISYHRLGGDWLEVE